MKRMVFKAMLCLLAVMVAPIAMAAYPDRPITLIIGYTAGGPTDIVGRYLAKGLERELGQPVVVENRPGANAVVALLAVKKAAPDGYTLYLGSSGTLSIEPVYKKHVSYDVLKDLTPIGLVASYPYLLVVPQASPYKTVQELIEGARKAPGKLSFASAGSGAVNHLAGEWFKSATNIQITHIPYKGDSDAIADLVAGRVDLAFLSAIAAMPQIRAQKFRVLGIASAEPSEVMPGMVTVAQAAGIPGFAAEPWNGVLGPAGMSPDVVNKLNAAINKVMGTPDARKALLALGQIPLTDTPAALAQRITEQTARWRDVIAKGHIEQGE